MSEKLAQVMESLGWLKLPAPAPSEQRKYTATMA